MTDNLNDDHQNDEAATSEEEDEAEATQRSVREEHAELLKAMVAEELASMKANVDKAYKKLEETTRENTRLKSEASEGKKKKLQDEGKHLEVANLRIAELEEKVRLATEANTRMTRDREVDRALAGLDWRTDYAKETAVNMIRSELVQDEEDGTWYHKSGASLNDFIKTFAKDPAKEFFFKPKENTGAGTVATKSRAKGRPASLEGLTTQELLALAAEGRLGSFG